MQRGMRRKKRVQGRIRGQCVHQRRTAQELPQCSERDELAIMAPLQRRPQRGTARVSDERHGNVQERCDATTDNGGGADRKRGTSEANEHKGRMEHDTCPKGHDNMTTAVM